MTSRVAPVSSAWRAAHRSACFEYSDPSTPTTMRPGPPPDPVNLPSMLSGVPGARIQADHAPPGMTCTFSTVRPLGSIMIAHVATDKYCK
jgi:hypothetical protein